MQNNFEDSEKQIITAGHKMGSNLVSNWQHSLEIVSIYHECYRVESKLFWAFWLWYHYWWEFKMLAARSQLVALFIERFYHRWDCETAACWWYHRDCRSNSLWQAKIIISGDQKKKITIGFKKSHKYSK